ncbi:MAG: sulfur oxidation c-type cytochrome SoxA [Gammaproteobacteria bacterium]|jgi:sulfur-oxidizing protein SoxA
MRKFLITTATLVAVGLASTVAQAATPNPKQDLKEFRTFFEKRFPKLPLKGFKDGAYAVGGPDKMQQLKDAMEFPPFEFDLAKGKKLFETPFANGKTYASCFKNGGKGIRQNYPYFDKATGQVRTLEEDINACRVRNGEKPLKWAKGALADISAYMASTSDGKNLHVVIPNDPRALAAYENGKQFFYARRGQLSLACADCHMYHSGQHLRANVLSPALGQPTGFPVYRAKWGALGTLHRRFEGCNKQVRAVPFKPQGVEYRDLEYFLTYMSNGIPVNAPSYRE